MVPHDDLLHTPNPVTLFVMLITDPDGRAVPVSALDMDAIARYTAWCDAVLREPPPESEEETASCPNS